MDERPLTWPRGQRKDFLKCVDCARQTLPQNAAAERPWAAAATLRIAGRVNDGALCPPCARTRRQMLGLPVEEETVDASELPRASAAGPKTIRVNTQECRWDVDTVESLLLKWRGQQTYEMYQNMDLRWTMVVLNDRPIPPERFGSVVLCDGDQVTIVAGRAAKTPGRQ